MNSFYTLLLSFVASTAVCSAETTVEESFITIVNECKSKENASDEDAVVVFNHDVPNSSTQKCLYACFYEKIGVIKENQMSMNSLKTLVLTKFSQDGNAITIINELIDECGVITGGDRCELAHDILECLNSGAKKRGINKKGL